MNGRTLTTKIILISGLALIVLGSVNFTVLYRAETRLVLNEMETLLNSEALALSALVNSRPTGGFEFEMSPSFFTQYKRFKPTGFFRFIDLRDGTIFHESLDAPSIQCVGAESGISKTISYSYNESTYRVKTRIFHPEIDSEDKSVKNAPIHPICLIVGVNELPYRTLVIETSLSTVPWLLLLVLSLIGILLWLVKRLTGDLSSLTQALEIADFGATHEFPLLPETRTVEARMVVDKLSTLHRQAADAYKEMWLFLGRAAHQLKTPVAAMQATLEVLLRRDRSKEELLAGLSDVEIAANQLAGLTRKLISSARLSYQNSSVESRMEVGGFLAEQVKIFQPLAALHQVTLKFSFQGQAFVNASSSILSDIFGNLIENAILYSPSTRGSTVTLSCTMSEDRVQVTISDEGSGFPAQVRNSLFKPFIRGDERLTPGSGLGLSITNKAVLILGGQIKIDKSDSSGSILVVDLPLSQSPD